MKRVSNVRFIKNDCGLKGWISENNKEPLFPWWVDRFEMEFHRYHSHLKVQVTIPGHGDYFSVAVFDYFAKDAISLYFFLSTNNRSKTKEIKKKESKTLEVFQEPIEQLSLGF